MADKITAFGGGVTLDKDLGLGLSVFTTDGKTAEELANFLDTMKNVGVTALKSQNTVEQLGKDNVELASGVLDGVKVVAAKDGTTLSMKVTEAAILKVMQLVPMK
jgi:predicted 3-demethylubiquinone-9 3-methyltransferase (glyoxalase superfamily)